MSEQENKSDGSLLKKRPRSRGDCVKGPRPCPWVSCRHHLGTDVKPRKMTKKRAKKKPPLLKIYEENIFGERPSCVLDLCEEGQPMTFEQIGEAIGLTKQRVEQIYRAAERNMKQALLENLEDEYGTISESY